MLLIANSCLAELLFGSDLFGMALFTLKNDLERRESEHIICIVQGYISYVGYSLQNYCFLLQAFYRFMIVIHPTHLYYQTAKFQLILIFTVWIFSFSYAIPILYTGQLKYNVANQICQMPLGFSFYGVYTALCIYGIPMSLIMGAYTKVVQYVRKLNKQVSSTNLVYRAERELKMIRRIVIIVLIIIGIGFPYAVFSFMAFFVDPPEYYLRIAFACVDMSLPTMMITLLLFTEPLKVAILKRLHVKTNLITAVAS
ncbi:unnamed protein product [Adineta ricciae]|uniref:G-protein coupled receptors family 1 profile domain-containing protein n=1 Tax=Adineta ricciae TaxID=249248 RepID=A0A815EX17_ADIRI|nr:unnamed protein product [Adineta ricciae]